MEARTLSEVLEKILYMKPKWADGVAIFNNRPYPIRKLRDKVFYFRIDWDDMGSMAVGLEDRVIIDGKIVEADIERCGPLYCIVWL